MMCVDNSRRLKTSENLEALGGSVSMVPLKPQVGKKVVGTAAEGQCAAQCHKYVQLNLNQSEKSTQECQSDTAHSPTAAVSVCDLWLRLLLDKRIFGLSDWALGSRANPKQCCRRGRQWRLNRTPVI
jgi:hypothetical protein